MKIAIIGSGISGLTCGHHLHKNHDVTIFEKNDYIGGHTNTIDVEDSELGHIGVDTGFIVFNKKTYPRFLKLMEKLKVPYQETSMSFSVKCEQTGLEYNGTSTNGLFAQRLNLIRPSFYKFIFGILAFNKAAKAYLASDDAKSSLGSFVASHRVSSDVVRFYLAPMASAVWSADIDEILDYPARFILNFWLNHGFLEVNDRPQWYVIKGGSREYVASITKGFENNILTQTEVQSVRRMEAGVEIQANNKKQSFDKVIFATHSPTALKILVDASANESQMLSAIPYQKNKAILHTQESILPKSKRAWAAWNYHLLKKSEGPASVTYNMNILQSLNTSTVYNVSLNTPFPIEPDRIIRELDYEHPVFTDKGVLEQQRYSQWMGENNTYFCGAYLRNGFHEDGVVTAERVCESLGGQI